MSFAIHPVAGKIPGCMNALLAEVNIDYEDVLESDKINNNFSSTDIVLVIGANYITNLAAKTDNSSLVYGNPIFDVGIAKSVLFIKNQCRLGVLALKISSFFKIKP